MLHLIAIKFSRFLNEVKAEIGNKKNHITLDPSIVELTIVRT